MVKVTIIACATDPQYRAAFVQVAPTRDAALRGALARWNIAHERYESGEQCEYATYAAFAAFIAGNDYWELHYEGNDE